MKNFLYNQKGQALVTLLFFTLIGVTVTAASIIVIATSSLGTGYAEQGSVAYAVAESGVENALLRLVRNPNYTGETLPVGNGSAEVQVVSGKIISTGRFGNTVRKIQVQTVYNNNVLTVTGWTEITN